MGRMWFARGEKGEQGNSQDKYDQPHNLGDGQVDKGYFYETRMHRKTTASFMMGRVLLQKRACRERDR